MVKLRFGTYTQWEYDTETGKQRVIKNFTKPVGKGTEASKPKPVKLTTQLSEEYI